jgi:hypothetical protein
MNCGFLIQGSVLNILVQATGRVHTEHIQEAGMIVKRITIDAMRRKISCKNENGASFRIGVVGFGCDDITLVFYQ